MRPGRAAMIAMAFSTGIGAVVATASAPGQDLGTSRSLGGFGAVARYVPPGMNDSGPMIIPYGGQFEGFMPGRMGGGAGLSFRARPATPMGTRRGAFRLAPLSGAMSGMSVGPGRTRPMGVFGPGRETGLGGMRRMPAGGRSSVMPPRIGYPFRQPPSLVSPSTGGPGMSM